MSICGINYDTCAMKLAYPVTAPDSRGNIKALMEGYEEAFSWMRQHGYEGVELLIRNPAHVEVERLDACLRQWDLKIAAIGTSPMQIEEKLFLMHADPENRKEAMRRCEGFLKLCGYYQAPALIGKYRGMIGSDPHCSWQYLNQVMTDICAQARTLGVPVLVEPQNATNINNLNTIDEALSWIEEMNQDNLGILADIYHMGITEESIEASLRRAAGKIGFIHMSDSDRKVPGEGTLPILSVLETLKDIGYPGYVSLEIDQKPDAKTACRKSAEYLLAGRR